MDEALEKQLMELRYVTARTGAIHELQSKNLRMWGYLVFREVKEIANISTYFNWDKRTVSYEIKSFPKLTKGRFSGLGRDCDRLNVWVQNLLGPEYAVMVKTDKEFNYKGKRQIRVPKSNKGVDFSG